jgi:glutamyl-tRNA reductase
MDLVCVGLNHHAAPVEIRERVAFEAQHLPRDLSALRALPGVREAVILSTCNRVEVYVHGNEPEASTSLSRFLHGSHGLSAGTLDGHLFTHVGDEAVRHLFRVASSLDAIVVGEPQILGQVKEAFRAAADARAVGPLLSRTFQRAFHVAKRVRTETGIAQSAVSVSFAAVELARTIFGGLRGAVCLLVGAGNMAELAAQHFVQDGAGLWVVNRSFERAESLATAYGGTARAFADLPLLLEKADVVLTSTAATNFLVEGKTMPAIMRARRYKPLFLIDISVPRNVDPAVTQTENVYAYDVDDLGRVVEGNKEKRRAEAARAEQLVLDETASFRTWLAGQAVVPTIKALRRRAETMVESELRRTLGNLQTPLNDKDLRSITSMANALVNKLLHEPVAALKAAGDSQEGPELAAAMRRLFALEPDEDGAGAGETSSPEELAAATLRAAEDAEHPAPPRPA